jgi:predicted permease
MNLALAIRVAIVTWIATFLATVLWHLPWFVFLSSCCLVIIVGALIARRYRGAERREGLVYVMAGLAFGNMILILPPDAPLRNVGATWFLVITIACVLIVVVLMLIPDSKEEKEKSKQR